jgi:glycosyltransferase involved in cell wall biosynthesis
MILHLINNLNTGGAEKLMATLLPELKSMGENPVVVCLNNQHDETIYQKLKEAAIPVYALKIIGSIYDFRLIFSLGRLIRKLNPEMIHVHLFPSFYWLAICKILFRIKIPLLATEHGTYNRRMNHPLFGLIEKVIYKQYHHIICISNGVLDAMHQRFPNLSCEVIFNGIPLKPFKAAQISTSGETESFSQASNLSERPTRLLSIGRLVKEKNHETLIRVMAKLPKEFHLTIAGEGDERGRIEQLIQELQVANQITMLGNVADVVKLIQETDIGLLCSKQEGFGLAAVEIMAGKKPVVLTRIPGLAELIPDTSLSADVGDVDKISAIILRLNADTTYYETMAEKCFEKAQLFSIQKMAQGYFSCYQRLRKK